MGYHFCLRKIDRAWQVIADLSRSDVPDAPERAAIRRSLPTDFPRTIFTSEWQRILEL